MPTYQYQCTKCGHTLEELQSISEPPLVHCPNCQTDSLVRIIGGGTGLIFKGSGFYLTDYKKSSSKGSEGGKKDKGKTSSDAGSDVKKE
ncbi:MAG TPA: zinc ribbon domain-containing protein [Bacteroidota bacterium]|nr:zinc ribbon domain-containing protein [Bacteroidota bacterium]